MGSGLSSPVASPDPCPAPAAAEGREAGTSTPHRPPLLDSGNLFRGRRVVEIAHNGEVYRLQATRLGKLILTK